MATYPILPTTVGKITRLTHPNGFVEAWDVVDEVRRNEDLDKIIILQHLRSRTDSSRYMLRFGYYIIGSKPKMRGKWVWGQFAPFIHAIQFAEIISEARLKKWI